MRNIALWNTAFLGDAVLSLPLLQSLRLRYPDARIDFYVRKGFEGLFAPHPDLNAVHAFDKRGGQQGVSALLRMAREVARRRYDLWISAHSSFRSGLLAFASRAPMRIGYDAPATNRLWYTHPVNRRFGELAEIERLLELLKPLGPGQLSTWPQLALQAEEAERAGRFFAALAGPVLGMHPGSVWATKRWPVANFAAIGLKALNKGADVLLFAGPGETDIARQVRDRILESADAKTRGRLHDLSGSLSLPALAAYIRGLSCYLTNDSGPMHLAWAQGVPVTALFGPTVRELGFFPRGEHSTVFEVDRACRPCGLHGPAACPLGHHHCMTQLPTEPVWRDVRNKLWPEEA